MTKHTWVEMAMVPIHPELRADGQIDIYATEGALEISSEETKAGCWFCHTPLSAESINAEDCQGAPHASY